MSTFEQHASKEEFERYRVGELTPAELLALDNHIAVCAECWRDFQEVMQCHDAFELFESKLRIEPPDSPDHPSLNELEALRSGRLNEIDREIISGHLEFCASCARRIRSNRLQSLWDRFTIFRRTLSHWVPVQAAAAAALAAILVWVPLHTQVRKMRAQLSEVQQNNLTIERNLQSQLAELRQNNHALEAKFGVAQTHMTSLQKDLAGQHDLQSQLAELRQGNHALEAKYGEAQSQMIALQNELNMQKANTVVLLFGKDADPKDSTVETARSQIPITMPEDLRGLMADSGRTRGSGKTIGGDAGNRLSVSLESPVGEYVLSNRPTFQWEPVVGATGYLIQISDENHKRFHRSRAIPGKYHQWESTTVLERGRKYEWYVVAIVDGKKVISPRAKFKVLEKREADWLTYAGRVFANNPLALGYSYLLAGLLSEAEEQLRMLPAGDKNAQYLLQTIRIIRDNTEDSQGKQN